MKKFQIAVSKNGTLRAIHGEQTAAMLKGQGPKEIRRASHVEPTGELSKATIEQITKRGLAHHLTPDAWWADMAPVGGPVLGPYPSRETALAEEVSWLVAKGVPAPLPKAVELVVSPRIIECIAIVIAVASGCAVVGAIALYFFSR